MTAPPKVVLDANLLVLRAVALSAPRRIGVFKPLKAFSQADAALLHEEIGTRGVVVTPNIMTEAANLLWKGLEEPDKSAVRGALKLMAERCAELYAPSAEACARPEFRYLDISDCASLSVLDRDSELLTVDAMLYEAALRNGFAATNFNHRRDGATL